MKKNNGFKFKGKKVTAGCLAAVLLTAAFSGCSGTGDVSSQDSTNSSTSSNTPAEPVKLKWYVVGNAPQEDQTSVDQAVTEYLKDSLNIELNVVTYDWGTYDQKLQMEIASQAEFDLCLTSNWLNNFYDRVNKNAFLPLDDLIDQYAKETKEMIPESGWESMKVKNVTYAVPNYQIWAMTSGGFFLKELVDKYEPDLSGVKTLKDLEPFLEQVKKDNPDMYPMDNGQGGILQYLIQAYGYDELAGRHIPGAILLDDQEMKVINQFELPQIKEHFKLMREWNKKGYFIEDAATQTDVGDIKKSGKIGFTFSGTMKPGDDANAKSAFGNRDVSPVYFSNSWLTTSGVTAAMTAISQTSKNPEAAMKLINAVNTDKELYNLLCFGIKDKHYTLDDKGYATPVENCTYNPGLDWVFGNQFNAYLRPGQEEDVWEQTQKINDEATPSPACGFAFDATAVQTEIASVTSVVKEYVIMFDTGSIDVDENYDVFLDKLKTAGSEKIIAEVQRQLDEWKASK